MRHYNLLETGIKNNFKPIGSEIDAGNGIKIQKYQGPLELCTRICHLFKALIGLLLCCTIIIPLIGYCLGKSLLSSTWKQVKAIFAPREIRLKVTGTDRINQVVDRLELRELTEEIARGKALTAQHYTELLSGKAGVSVLYSGHTPDKISLGGKVYSKALLDECFTGKLKLPKTLRKQSEEASLKALLRIQYGVETEHTAVSGLQLECVAAELRQKEYPIGSSPFKDLKEAHALSKAFVEAKKELLQEVGRGSFHQGEGMSGRIWHMIHSNLYANGTHIYDLSYSCTDAGNILVSKGDAVKGIEFSLEDFISCLRKDTKNNFLKQYEAHVAAMVALRFAKTEEAKSFFAAKMRAGEYLEIDRHKVVKMIAAEEGNYKIIDAIKAKNSDIGRKIGKEVQDLQEAALRTVFWEKDEDAKVSFKEDDDGYLSVEINGISCTVYQAEELLSRYLLDADAGDNINNYQDRSLQEFCRARDTFILNEIFKLDANLSFEEKISCLANREGPNLTETIERIKKMSPDLFEKIANISRSIDDAESLGVDKATA